MKHLNLVTAVVLLVLTVALSAPALADPASLPYSYISVPPAMFSDVPSFSIGYHAESGAGGAQIALPPSGDPLAFVWLWYRYSSNFCDWTDWMPYVADTACAGLTSCDSSFPFTASAQGIYEFKTIAHDQGGGVEDKCNPNARTVVDYGPPTIGGTNPLDGAVVFGTINVGAYFNDSWGLRNIRIWDDSYFSFNKDWLWQPLCAPVLGTECITAKSKAPSALGQSGLPAGTYSLQWDTTKTMDGLHTICYAANDLALVTKTSAAIQAESEVVVINGVYQTKICTTVIVNNDTAKPPQLLSATANGGATAAAMSVHFVGLAPPAEMQPRASIPVPEQLGVEIKIEGADLATAIQSDIVPVESDFRWSYTVPLSAGNHQASFRTRTEYGAYSEWVMLDFDPAALPANLTMLTKGYDGYDGAAETYINLWDPGANKSWDKAVKVRSFDVINGLSSFDTASLAGVTGGQVKRAGLVFWNQGRTNPQEMELSVYPVMAEWSAGEATWLEASVGLPWTLPGAGAEPDDFVSTPSASGMLRPGDWLVLDVTEIVRGWQAGMIPANGFLLKGVSEGSVEYTLGTSDHTQPGYRPILFVEWGP